MPKTRNKVQTTRPRPSRHHFTPKRGRPTAAQAASISRSILDAAAERFLSIGYEASSMEAIAASAGIPKSTLYKRYRDKMSLLRAVVRDRVSTWSAISTEDSAALGTDIEQRLKRHAEWVLHWGSSDEVRAFRRLAAGSWQGAAEVAQILNEFGYVAMVDYLESELGQFGVEPGKTLQDPRYVAIALMALLSGWLMQTPLNRPITRAAASRFAHKAVDLLIKGRAAW
jgi:TetR/AcrR family transcriptional repressor of mexJK operon